MAEQLTREQVEEFIVRHYTDEPHPCIKGNGFDGLTLGDYREEAEAFVKWINERLALRAIAQLNVRVLYESDAFCPCCGHNRDWSLVSTIDNGDGAKTCQLCSAQWRELRTIEQRGAAGNIESRTESPYNGASSTFEAGSTAAPLQNSAAQVRVPASGIASTGSDPTPASAEPNSWMCGCGWVNRINWATCGRCDRTINEGSGRMIKLQSEQQATTRGKPETVSDTAPVPAVSDLVARLRKWGGEEREQAADLIERLWQLNIDDCETDTNCRKLLAKWDMSDNYSVVPLEDLIATALRDPEYLECCALRKAAEQDAAIKK